tara:strand:- start:1562 stop:1828 length:267 start_codon:yes stop_codon:yes gene_type:complete
MDNNEQIKILEHNVSEVTTQLYNSYARIAELTKEKQALEQQRDDLMHHQLSASEITSKGKKVLTTYVEDAMNLNIKTFQNILGKLKGA